MIANTYPIQNAGDVESSRLLTIIDLGNGDIKALVKLTATNQWARIVFPSVLRELPEYETGSFALNDRFYMVGDEVTGPDCIRTGETARGKIDNALPLLAGVIRKAFPMQREITTDVIFTAPSVKQYGEPIKEMLSGSHTVRMPADDQLLTDEFSQTITVGTVSAQLEGYRAVELARQSMSGSRGVLFDIGNRTTIVTVFERNGKIVDRKPFDNCGVRGMASRLVTSEALATADGLKLTPNEDDVIDFLFSNKARKAKGLYIPQLEICLRDAISFTAGYAADADVFLLGGGAGIPAIESVFPKGLKPKKLDDPQWANVEGLKLIADKLIARA